MTGSNSTFDFADERLVVQFGDFFWRKGLADAEMNRTRRRQFRRPRPGVERAVKSDRQDHYIPASSQGAKARLQGSHGTIKCARSLGKEQHGLAAFDSPHRLTKSSQPKALTVQRNRVEKLDQQAKRSEAKERLAGKIVEAAIEREADEYRIEKALVIGTHEQRAAGGDTLASLAAHSKDDHHRKTSECAEDRITESLQEGTLRHRRAASSR